MTLILDRNELIGTTEFTPHTSIPDVATIAYDEGGDVATPVEESDPGYLAHARQLTSEYPDSATAFARLAQAELAAGNRVSAGAASKSAIEKAQPHDKTAVSAAARVLASVGDDVVAEALVADSDAAPDVGAALLAVRHGDINRASSILQDRSDPTSLAVRGWIALERRDSQRAIRLLKRATRHSAAPPTAHINLGFAYASLGQWDKAIDSTRRAVRLLPDLAMAGLNLARFLALSGDQSAAREELTHLIGETQDFRAKRVRIQLDLEISNDVSTALNHLKDLRLNRVWRDVSDVDRAELDADILLLTSRAEGRPARSVVPDLLRLLEEVQFGSLGIARVVVGSLDRLADAATIRTVYEEMESRSVPALNSIETRLAMSELRFDDALEAAKRWQRSDPFDVLAAAIQSYLYSEYTMDYDKAAEVARRGLRTNPGNELLENNLTYALICANRLEEAARAMPKTVDHPSTAATEGLLALKRGRIDEGIAWYDRAAEMAVAQGEAELAIAVLQRKTVALAECNVDVELDVSSVDDASHETAASFLMRRRLEQLGP